MEINQFNSLSKMRNLFFIVCLLLGSISLHAQTSVKNIGLPSIRAIIEKQSPVRNFGYYDDYLVNSKGAFSDSLPVDTTIHDRYGDLLNDDPIYNKRYCILIPFTEVIVTNVGTWAMDKYLLKADFANVGPETWQSNIKQGWEWDTDRFGINFIGHPYSGTLYFNHARSNGYTYAESFCFAVEGSLMWEYFGENTRPSYNDIIATPVNGAFLGEIFYRISSNILDDSKRGGERFFRELAAGVIDPMRGVNRIFQGKMFRVLPNEVYQKAPLNVTLFGGIHQHNIGKKFMSGGTSAMFNLQLDYGTPFEKKHWQPFDLFKIRTEFSFGVGRKILDNINGYGILFGKTYQPGKLKMLFGAFQYYDYWDNNTFELGATAFGAGLLTGLPVGKKSNLYLNFHLAAVPFAGVSYNKPDTASEVRDYAFGNGLEGKFEATFNILDRLNLRFMSYSYWLNAFSGPKGNNFISVMEPTIAVNIYKGISLGFEEYLYFDDKHLTGKPKFILQNTQQKIFLLVYLEDPKRRGHYN